MKLLIRSPAFSKDGSTNSVSLKCYKDLGSETFYTVCIRVPRQSYIGQLRIYVERNNECEEFAPKSRLPVIGNMLVNAIASALRLPLEFVRNMSVDERRILGLLLLEGGQQVQAWHIAFALSGSFRGVTNEHVGQMVDCINKLLLDNNVSFQIDGSVVDGFCLVCF